MDLHFDYNYSKFLSELVYEVTHKLIRDIPELKDFGHNFPFSRKDLEVNGNSKQAFEMLVWNIYWNMYVFKGTQNFPHFLIYYQNVLFFSCLLNILHQIKNKEVLFENAIKYFRKAIKLNPTQFPKYYSNLALTYDKAGKKDDAVRIYNKIKKKFPNYQGLDFMKMTFEIKSKF